MSSTFKPQLMNGFSLTQFRFLNLPKDIRFLIYEYLVVSRVQPTAYKHLDIAYEATKIDPGIIQVSRQIHYEVCAATLPRRMGKLVLYLTEHYNDSTELSKLLAMVYGSEEHRPQLYAVDIYTVMGVLGRWDPSPTLTDLLFKVFYQPQLSTITLPDAYQKYNIRKVRSLMQQFFEYVHRLFRHSPRVQYRFMIWANHDDILYRSALPSQKLGVGYSPLRYTFILICADKRTRGLVLEQQRLQTPNDLSTSLATTEEMAYMRATMIYWGLDQPAQPRVTQG